MLRKQNRRIGVVFLLIFSMLAIYGSVPTAKAANLDSAKAVLDDSNLDATATTTVTFNTGIDLTAGTVVTLAFNASFDVSGATTTCPSDATADAAGQNVTCTVVSTLSSTTDYTVIIADVNNPDAENVAGYDITISHNEGGGAESTQMRVYIIDPVTVTATVNATLAFSVDLVGGATDVNGVQTTGASTATTLDFGTLNTAASSTLAQQLSVTTNASAGYSVTVQQDQDMTSGGSATINAFDNGVIPGAPTDWGGPDATLGSADTYGHMGVTSEDQNLSGGDTFGLAQYDGLDGTTPLEVLYNGGAANGTEAHTSRTEVAYTIEISALQEAGDYTNTLTYVCTPTY